ncbi:hypothetical protein [Negadavirga shengliensis]|uniref:Uncharacterized protein n=1 Tax=Negadavirga shengliensis TaxID=1389218 RepID=A0ABV9T4H0_9BACT
MPQTFLNYHLTITDRKRPLSQLAWDRYLTVTVDGFLRLKQTPFPPCRFPASRNLRSVGKGTGIV